MIKHTIAYCLLLFMVSLGTSSLHAQRFNASVVAGMNLSQLDGDDLVGFSKVGVNAGVKVNTVLTERWQLSLEMLYAQQGSARNNNDRLSAAVDKIALNFVEVPLMINFLEWKFHVSAGISYARLINYTVTDNTGEDVTDLQSYNPNIYSMIFGATYFFNDHLGLNISWSKYLNDLQAEEGANRLIGRTIAFRMVYAF